MSTKVVESLILIVFGGVMLYALHHILAGHSATATSPAHGAGDWAAWVGAIGTVGTLIGTVFLATSEARRRKHLEDTLARLTAASFVHKIESVKNAVRAVIALAEYGPEDLPISELERIANLLAGAARWTPEQAVPLAPLPNHLAERIAAMSSIADELGHCFAEATKNPLMHDFSRRRNFVDAMGASAEHDMARLGPASEECRAAGAVGYL